MFKLRSQIMLSFSLIILIGTVLMVLAINFSTRYGYRTFVRKNDIEITKQLKNPLTEYYRLNGSWEGIEQVMQFPMLQSNQMRGMMGKNQGGNMRGTPVMPSIIVTDEDGRIVFSSSPSFLSESKRIEEHVLIQGQKIMSGTRTVGFVLAGSMVETELNEQEKLFLNRTILIVVVVSLLILGASAVFSWFFSSRLSRPVSAMRTAAEQIRSGDLSVRVNSEGNDELSRLSYSFNQMTESLERNDQWRKQIIADSAHELRTPVSLIQGNLEMILDGVYEADNERIQNIFDETLVLTRLIEELQLLSSAESGSMKLNPEEISLNELIDNVLSIFQVGEAKEGIDLKNLITESLPPVQGDYQKLKQVFANVLANAFRHTPSGGEISLSANKSTKNIDIIIEDSGPGIDEEDLEKIFERFYRTDSSRNREQGGSGLGLAISREILKLHGGKIYAKSPEGKGAQIFISLPFKK